MRNQQVCKRAKKMIALAQEIAKLEFEIFGNPQADIGIISWGSNKGPILEALKLLGKSQPAFLNLPVVWPFPEKQFKDFIKNKKTLINIECNSTSQLGQIIRQLTGIKIAKNLCKFDGRPFYPEEIADFIKKI
jgi:2-oxoglutarate ferredoxin oxidoreductase subunit alpha